MSDATTEKVKRVWTTYHPDRFTTTVDEKEAQFDAWLQGIKDEAYREGFEDANEELQGPA